jgi:hypothetical protein
MYRMDRRLYAPNAARTVDRAAPFLKAHMRDGALYVLSRWDVNENTRALRGNGVQYNAARHVVHEGELATTIDSVVLFETNVTRTSPSVAALAVVAGVTAGVAVYCATNPKACFGSCPTFYLTDGTRESLQAEGFSASIAPSLEARDLDVLYRAQPRGRDVRIDMVNEAYETHVVRYANLIIAPRAGDHRVLPDAQNRYWSVSAPIAPTVCRAPEGDCRVALAAFDGQERLSAADSTSLSAREYLDLEFDASLASPALVLASRQSLLPTYVLYQAFAWMGSSATDWMASLERGTGETVRQLQGPAAALGGIDVLVDNGEGGWDSVATIRETGPLAADVKMIPLPYRDLAARSPHGGLQAPQPVATSPLRVRLRMAKGAWRVDAAMLVSRVQQVQTRRLTPRVVSRNGRPDIDARNRLHDTTQALVTFPGDRYTLQYTLPANANEFELFLETKGYYLEWMRDEWLAEQNPLRAAELFLDPSAALRRLAPAYKREEAALEQAFWRSKYAGFR